MALPLLNNAESQASGTTVTTGNSAGTDATAFDGVTVGAGMTLTYDSGITAAHGTNAFKFALTGASTAATYLEWTSTSWGTADAHVYGAFYFRTNVASIASTARVVSFLNGGTLVGQIGAVNGNQGFQFRDSAGASVGTISGTISANTWYRVEFDVLTGGAGVATLNVYVGDSTTLQGSATISSATAFPNSVNNIRLGFNTANFSSTSGDYILLDDLHVNDTALPGPGPYSAGAAPAVEPVYFWPASRSPRRTARPGGGPCSLVETRYAEETLAVGAQALDGLSAGTSTTTGDLVVTHTLDGASAATSTTTGALTVAHPLAGSSAGTSTSSGDVTVAHSLAGTSAGTSTTTGDATATHPLAGTSAGTSTSTGDLAVTHPLAGTSAGTSTTTGDLSLAGQQALAGTSAGTSTTAGALNVTHPLAGTSAGSSTTTGALAVTHPIAGTSAGTSTSSGDLILVKPLAGTSAGTSTTTGAAVITRGLAGSSAGTSTSTGDAKVAHTLTGLSSGASTTTGDLRAALVLAAVSAGSSTTTGDLSIAGLIQAVGRLESDVDSTVTDARSVITATDSTGAATSTEAAGGVLALTE